MTIIQVDVLQITSSILCVNNIINFQRKLK